MAKAKELECQLVASGIRRAKTVSKLRAILRLEPGLLHCSGQGYASRHIVASDVTAFFLGLVAADQLENAPAVIKLARAAPIYLAASENCDPWPFVGIGKDQTLGDFLDALFAGTISSSSEPGFDHWEMRFEFQIAAGDFRYFANLIFEAGDVCHIVKFFGLSAEIRANLDIIQTLTLPAPPQVDRLCIVRTQPLRDLIAFTRNALLSDAGQQ